MNKELTAYAAPERMAYGRHPRAPRNPEGCALGPERRPADQISTLRTGGIRGASF